MRAPTACFQLDPFSAQQLRIAELQIDLASPRWKRALYTSVAVGHKARFSALRYCGASAANLKPKSEHTLRLLLGKLEFGGRCVLHF